MIKKNYIAIIGLGYVGLPLAIALGKKDFVTGYDNNINKIKYLKKGIDKNKIFTKYQIKNSKVNFTYDKKYSYHWRCGIHWISYFRNFS